MEHDVQLLASFRTTAGQLLKISDSVYTASGQLLNLLSFHNFSKIETTSRQLLDSFRTAFGQLPDSFQTTSNKFG